MVDKAKRSVWFDDLEEIVIKRVRDRVSKEESDDQQAVPGGHRRVSTGQAANVAILLRLFGPFHRYLGLSGKTLEGAVRPERPEELEATQKNWFA